MEDFTISNIWGRGGEDFELDFDATMKVDGKSEHIQKVSKLPSGKFLVTLERFQGSYHDGENRRAFVSTFQELVEADEPVDACLV